MIYKFVNHEIPPLESLADTFPAIVHRKLETGEPLTDDEKAMLEREVNTSMSKGAIHRMGWSFNFIDFMNLYWLKSRYGHISEAYAFTKQGARKACGQGYGHARTVLVQKREPKGSIS